MNRLLLNSSLSDDVNLGNSEQFIPKDPDLEDRIIRFKTRFKEVDPDEIDAFFKSYDHLQKVEGKSTRAAAEFFLERFFEERRGNFDYLGYIEGQPGSTRETSNYIYEFIDNGRGIRVYNSDRSQVVTEISRLVEIRKGEEKQIVLCDTRANRSTKTKFKTRIKTAKELIGGGCTLSYMFIYASDVFNKAVSPNKRRYTSNPEFKSDIEEYLRKSYSNLLLVYSTTTFHIDEIGKKVLARI